mmetsp:Transcript_19278/g.48568  ORF Transcript_19278/g.48568 Transcript_19278/m.48568 type:complete len:186 (-) Transcript_19278:229-786(-)
MRDFHCISCCLHQIPEMPRGEIITETFIGEGGRQRIRMDLVLTQVLLAQNLILAHKNDITSVKIADFGLAVRAEGRTLTAVCGTPQYVAPEVLRSARDGPYDHRCDIWSCGIVLFNMLAGYPPFHSESVPKLLRQVALAEVDYCDPVWELISPEATDLLQKVLTATAEERISVAEALVHPWMMHR